MNPLKPVRFYGRALPRPRFLEGGDADRVSPPAPVNDSLLRWAKEANWAMGGLSFKRQRMQGKIEGRLSKLKYMEEESPKKKGKKSKSSSPDMTSKKLASSKRTRNAGRTLSSTGNESLVVEFERSAAIHPVFGEWGEKEGLAMGEWGEEDGPTPRRTSPRLHASSPLKQFSHSSPVISLSSPPVPSQSVEFPVRRRQVERSTTDTDDTESEVNWEEFRLRDRPLRRSSRVTSIRRSFKDFALATDSDS